MILARLVWFAHWHRWHSPRAAVDAKGPRDQHSQYSPADRACMYAGVHSRCAAMRGAVGATAHHNRISPTLRASSRTLPARLPATPSVLGAALSPASVPLLMP